MRSVPTSQHDSPEPERLRPLPTIDGWPAVVRRRLPRRERSVLHAAETEAWESHAYGALAWFKAAEMEPPMEWLIRIGAAEIGEAAEYFGHAIRMAVRDENERALLEVAKRAKRRRPVMARLATRAARGRDVLEEVERQMTTGDIDLERARVPSRKVLNAPPPTLATLSEMHGEHIQEPGYRLPRPLRYSNQMRAMLRRLLVDQRADPLVGFGSELLGPRFQSPAWAWRFFEAAEQLREEPGALDESMRRDVSLGPF